MPRRNHSRSKSRASGQNDGGPARDLAAIEARRALRLLEAVAADSTVTQRGLSSKLGVALGLTNLYLKRLVRKGFIKCVNVQSNRLLYLITPKGIGEKTRLTYEFMEYSLWLYKETRRHLHVALEPEIRSGAKRFAIYGTGEAAELAYLSLKEHGLEPAAIFDDLGGHHFLGMRVRDIKTSSPVEFDFVIVATLDDPQNEIANLASAGVSRDQLVTVRKVDGRS
jgi:ribosomal protein S25